MAAETKSPNPSNVGNDKTVEERYEWPVEDSKAWLERVIAQKEFTFIVYFRGKW